MISERNQNGRSIALTYNVKFWLARKMKFDESYPFECLMTTK